MADMQTDAPAGFYCSTSGTYFNDKQSLSEHYKSDFHKYNLKRKASLLALFCRSCLPDLWAAHIYMQTLYARECSRVLLQPSYRSLATS